MGRQKTRPKLIYLSLLPLLCRELRFPGPDRGSEVGPEEHPSVWRRSWESHHLWAEFRYEDNTKEDMKRATKSVKPAMTGYMFSNNADNTFSAAEKIGSDESATSLPFKGSRDSGGAHRRAREGSERVLHVLL